MIKKILLLAISLGAVAGCGGGSNAALTGSTGSTGGTGGTGSGGTGGTLTVQLGTGTGTSFQSGLIGISSASLSAGGSTSLTVSLVQSDGTLYTQSTAITFNSPCVAAGTAAIQPLAAVTTTTGTATVTYVAKGCSGPDVVTATATAGSSNLTASGTVTVAQAAIGSIAFVSATPTNIALKGTGDASRPESSTVVFKVLDASGGPRAGVAVHFTLNTNVGGITLTPSAATADSDAQGLAQIVVNAGTVASSVKVTATVTTTTPQISTQSSQLTITTGIPTAGSFSLAEKCANIEGWDIDGTIDQVTARLGDRFNNPVPDGTAITFTSEGGNIQPQCLTTTTATEGGVCTVNWRSSNPRPADGRVSLLAKAIGEESFVDANGNGAFDTGETFTDLPEPYRDDNENGVYDPGEDFIDFNNNGSRDPADGLFNGVLCNDTAGHCGASSTRSTGIGQQGIIIMSGSSPVVTNPDGSPFIGFHLAASSARAITVWVRDARGNPMPGGTEVSASASGGGLTVAAPSKFSTVCVNPANFPVNAQGPATIYSFTVTSGTTTGTGLFTLEVKTPSGLDTIYQISITVP